MTPIDSGATLKTCLCSCVIYKACLSQATAGVDGLQPGRWGHRSAGTQRLSPNGKTSSSHGVRCQVPISRWMDMWNSAVPQAIAEHSSQQTSFIHLRPGELG